MNFEGLLFGLLVGISMALFGLVLHQKFQTSPAKRLFPEEIHTTNHRESSAGDSFSSICQEVKGYPGVHQRSPQGPRTKEKTYQCRTFRGTGHDHFHLL